MPSVDGHALRVDFVVERSAATNATFETLGPRAPAADWAPASPRPMFLAFRRLRHPADCGDRRGPRTKILGLARTAGTRSDGTAGGVSCCGRSPRRRGELGRRARRPRHPGSCTTCGCRCAAPARVSCASSQGRSPAASFVLARLRTELKWSSRHRPAARTLDVQCSNGTRFAGDRTAELGRLLC